MHGPQIVVLPDPETLALRVATAVVVEARSAVERGGRFSIALSGGSTPRPTLSMLARAPFSEEMPWDVTHVFWSDERCVDPSDPRSNERMAREALLDHVPLSCAQVHPMRCEGDPEAAAAEYEKVLRSHRAPLDLVLLGLGEDGHTASLFPGAATVREKERLVVADMRAPAAGGVAGDEEHLGRITLTLPCINQAAAVFVIVSGGAKSGILKRVLEEGADAVGGTASPLPAGSVRPASGRLTWFVDHDAATRLPSAMVGVRRVVA